MVKAGLGFAARNFVRASKHPVLTSRIAKATLKGEPLDDILTEAAGNDQARKDLFDAAVDFVEYQTTVRNVEELIPEVAEKRFYLSRALLRTLQRAYDAPGRLSENYRKNLMNVLLGKVMMEGIYKRTKRREEKKPTPVFILFHPTDACNRKCEYCYSDSTGKGATLPYWAITRIIKESKEIFGTNFFVLSGGEPTIWKDKKAGKNIADIFEENQDCFFIMFTNGSVMVPEYAKRHNFPTNLIERFSKAGNNVPCISNEGEITDDRRGFLDGKPMTWYIRTSKDLCVASGVPILYSITHTSVNMDDVNSPEFHNKNLRDGVLGEWNFHAMPIGRIRNRKGELHPEQAIGIMPTPEQRKRGFDSTWKYVKEKEAFNADFWNASVAGARKNSPGGCINAGSDGGHFSIKGNGDATPCEFFPAVDRKKGNIYQVWDKGGTVEDLLYSDLFIFLREKQQKHKNYLLPCMFRDLADETWEVFHNGIARPLDKGTAELISNPELKERFFANMYGCRKIMTPGYLK